jgi:hypothetical protein
LEASRKKTNEKASRLNYQKAKLFRDKTTSSMKKWDVPIEALSDSNIDLNDKDQAF